MPRNAKPSLAAPPATPRKRKASSKKPLKRDPAALRPQLLAICQSIDRGDLRQHTGHAKGHCALAAAIGRCDVARYAATFAVPGWVAVHADLIFDNLSPERAMSWPLEVALAIGHASPNRTDMRVAIAVQMLQDVSRLDDASADMRINLQQLDQALRTPAVHRQWETEAYINATLRVMKANLHGGDIRSLTMYRCGLRAAQWLDHPAGSEDLQARVALASQSFGAVAAWEQQGDLLLRTLTAPAEALSTQHPRVVA